METLFGECGRRTVVFMFIVSATSIATTIAFNHERFRVSGTGIIKIIFGWEMTIWF